MIKVDSKDRKILYHLILDSRQSFKSIGKKVEISKESANYRIKRLVENNIITDFTTQINFVKLGYSNMITYYRFTNINPQIKKEIIDYFINNKNSNYVSLIEGHYDLQVDFFLGDPFEFESMIDDIQNKFYKYLSFQSSKFYIRGEFYNYRFLLDEKTIISKPFIWHWGIGLVKIDELDFNIIRELSINSRIPTMELAKKLNSTVSAVTYRIKKLVKEGIILSYTINVDWLKIGYRWFHLQINLRDYSKKNQIIKHIRQNPNLIRYLKHLIIGVDLHFTFLLNNMQQLRNIIDDITTNFPDSINDYHFYSTFKTFKFNLMVPKLLKHRNPLYHEY